MTGVVASGTAIPGVRSSSTNTSTGAKDRAEPSVPTASRAPGQTYSARFTAKGFAASAVNNIPLLVNSVRTQNATRRAGFHRGSHRLKRGPSTPLTPSSAIV